MKRGPKVEIYQGRDGQWYWRLKSGNGRVVADGSEGYASARNARRAWHATERMVLEMDAYHGVRVVEP